MHDPGIRLTRNELNLIQDTDFLVTKVIVLEKIKMLFSSIQELIKTKSNLVQEHPLNKNPGKISKGENYRQLPYMVLDYPAHFNRSDIFAFRTMFWWGHHFSATLHLQGKFLEQFRSCILENIDTLQKEGVYLGVGESPWEYHFEKKNYQLINRSAAHQIESGDFIKLSRRYDLNQFDLLPDEVLNYYLFLEKLIQQ
ncbi:MAG: hypothetical protein KDC80_24545 [Saprospiraceae bacterium]|nr:hypothetical protein [Saprospiraceae bacterium]